MGAHYKNQGEVSVNDLLKKHGLIKFEGKIIVPSNGKFYVNGISFDDLTALKSRREKLAKA